MWRWTRKNAACGSRTRCADASAYEKLTREVINNSCGTLAALNAVMNIPSEPSPYPDESIELGVGDGSRTSADVNRKS